MKNPLANNPCNLVADKTAVLTSSVDIGLAPETVAGGSRPGQVESRGAPLWLVAGFWASILIAVVVVVRRLIAIAHPSQIAPPQMAALDAVFASHTALTLAHIVPAMAFVLLIPFFFCAGPVRHGQTVSCFRSEPQWE